MDSNSGLPNSYVPRSEMNRIYITTRILYKKCQPNNLIKVTISDDLEKIKYIVFAHENNSMNCVAYIGYHIC